jgi:exosortase family protein XrtG
VLSRAKLYFWKFLAGSVGLFLLLMILFEPVLTQPIARAVSALAGVVGSLTGVFTSYFKYGIIFIPMSTGAMTLKIDFECSGIIEIMAFISLLAFFRVYKPYERVIVGIIGTAYIMVCNALRIVIVCLALHFFGQSAYFITHTFIGRIFFYALSVLLYFYVFTKPQVVQMKVGNFSYGRT